MLIILHILNLIELVETREKIVGHRARFLGNEMPWKPTQVMETILMLTSVSVVSMASRYSGNEHGDPHFCPDFQPDQ